VSHLHPPNNSLPVYLSLILLHFIYATVLQMVLVLDHLVKICFPFFKRPEVKDHMEYSEVK